MTCIRKKNYLENLISSTQSYYSKCHHPENHCMVINDN